MFWLRGREAQKNLSLRAIVFCFAFVVLWLLFGLIFCLNRSVILPHKRPPTLGARRTKIDELHQDLFIGSALLGFTSVFDGLGDFEGEGLGFRGYT